MKLRYGIVLIVILAATVVVKAERPPEQREDANLVITGKVTKITTAKSKFGSDGEMTTYTAEVEVTKVEKGDGAKAGDTAQVSWFHVTKKPSRSFPGAYGQNHALKEKDEATFWLMKSDKKVWDVIYNTKGVEKVKK